MKVIICGAGEVGKTLAEHLSKAFCKLKTPIKFKIYLRGCVG